MQQNGAKASGFSVSIRKIFVSFFFFPLHEGYARQGSNMSVLRTRPAPGGPTESLLGPLAVITQGLFKMKQKRRSRKSFLCHAFPIASVHSHVEAAFIPLLSMKCSLRTCWSNILIWISTNTFLPKQTVYLLRCDWCGLLVSIVIKFTVSNDQFHLVCRYISF